MRVASHRTVPDDRDPTEEHIYHRGAELNAVEDAALLGGLGATRGDDPAAVRIDQGDVAVVAGSDSPLIVQAVPWRRISAGETGDVNVRYPTFSTLGDQTWQQIISPTEFRFRDQHFLAVRAKLELLATAGLIRDDPVNIAAEHMFPECFTSSRGRIGGLTLASIPAVLIPASRCPIVTSRRESTWGNADRIR